jgi:hypothetical protein
MTKVCPAASRAASKQMPYTISLTVKRRSGGVGGGAVLVLNGMPVGKDIGVGSGKGVAGGGATGRTHPTTISRRTQLANKCFTDDNLR